MRFDIIAERTNGHLRQNGRGRENRLIGFLFSFPFCEAIHTLFLCIADVCPYMHAPLGSIQVTSKPTTIPVPLYPLSAILTSKSVIVADFSCMTTHNRRDYIKLLR